MSIGTDIAKKLEEKFDIPRNSSRTYSGFNGGISLLEDIVGKVAMPF